MLKFEEYLQEFNSTVNLAEFLINLATAALLALLLRWFYIKFGSSISNRHKFAQNFVPLALTTLLIITVIKSSLALSLGLVGALSIVRFRAAIKDPEELTYLFLTIAIGLVSGANKPLLAILAIICILPLIYFNQKIKGKSFELEDKMFVNINTDNGNLSQISDLLKKHFRYVELKRMDHVKERLDLSFICNVESLESLETVRKSIADLSESTKISFVDKPDLVL